MNARNVKLVGTTIIVLIGIAAYFFIVSPFLTQRADHQANIEEVETRLDTVRTNIATLETDQSILEPVQLIDFGMSNMFPATADINSLRSEIYSIAGATGVSVNINSVPPVIIQEPVAEVAEPVAEDAEVVDPAATDPAAVEGEVAPDAAAEVPPVPEAANIAQFGVSVTAEGSLEGVMAFLDQMNNITRGVLVTSANITLSSGGTGEDAGPQEYALTFEATSFIHRTTPTPVVTENPDGTTTVEIPVETPEGEDPAATDPAAVTDPNSTEG